MVGPFATDGSISGKVTSGVAGSIGTFKVTRDPKRTAIAVKPKYFGTWEGVGRLVAQNRNVIIGIQLQPSMGSPTVNPVNYELDFTPGRICGYSLDGITVSSYGNVAIDYLRHQITMSAPDGSTSIDLKIDFATKMLSGIQKSAMWGVTTQFNNLPEVQALKVRR